MKFMRVTDITAGTEPLHDRLVRDLSDSKAVLWLVPGGSNIPLTTAVMAELPDELTNNLTIMLTDERYGVVGHTDSNAYQLDEAGFTPKQATIIPVLIDGLTVDETCKLYAEHYQAAAQRADVIIGQFGMGADGHIAGILPASPAVTSGDLATSYIAPPFERVTLTPKALQQLTVAYVFAFGSGKRQALETLQSQALGLDEQPAQIIKQLPEAYVYNDQVD